MNKHFTLVLIAGIISLSLSACGSDTATSPSSAADSTQTLSSAQSASTTSDDLKSEYKEAVDYISSDQCKNFRTRSQDLVGIAYGDLIAEGDAAAIDDVVEEYSSLVAALPDAYDKPQSTKELYAYLNIWGEYQLSAFEKFRDAARAVRENNTDKAIELMESGTADMSSAGEAAQGFADAYKKIAEEYKAMS